MSHLDEWQPLSNRYGHHDEADRAWAARHAPLSTHEPTPGPRRCDCPGSNGYPQCRQTCTQEDLLCDECRQWCYAMDAAGNYHQFATLRSR